MISQVLRCATISLPCGMLLHGCVVLSLLISVIFPKPEISAISYSSIAKVLSSRGILSFYSSVTALPLEVVGKLFSGRAAPVENDGNGQSNGVASCSSYVFSSAPSIEAGRGRSVVPEPVLTGRSGGDILLRLCRSPALRMREGLTETKLFLLEYFVVLHRSNLPDSGVGLLTHVR